MKVVSSLVWVLRLSVKLKVKVMKTVKGLKAGDIVWVRIEDKVAGMIPAFVEADVLDYEEGKRIKICIPRYTDTVLDLDLSCCPDPTYCLLYSELDGNEFYIYVDKGVFWQRSMVVLDDYEDALKFARGKLGQFRD